MKTTLMGGEETSSHPLLLQVLQFYYQLFYRIPHQLMHRGELLLESIPQYQLQRGGSK